MDANLPQLIATLPPQITIGELTDKLDTLPDQYPELGDFLSNNFDMDYDHAAPALPILKGFYGL